MSFLQALDAAIAMTLIYFLLSLVVAALTEVIAARVLQLRSKTLYDWVVGVLHKPSAATAFYNHPLIRTLEEVSGSTLKPIRKPSYIPDRTFAIAVLDFLDVRSGTLAQAQTALKSIPKTDNRYELAQTVLPLLDGTTGNIKDSQEAIAVWFNSAMDRVSGWYKRRVAWMTFLLSLFITLLANASTIDLVQILWNDQALRQAFVEQAGRVVETGEQAARETLNEAISDLPLPLGWNVCEPQEANAACINIRSDESRVTLSALGRAFGREAGANALGWLITAVLLSFGSRFWFDALSKLVNIRLAGQKPSESDASNKKQVEGKTP